MPAEVVGEAVAEVDVVVRRLVVADVVFVAGDEAYVLRGVVAHADAGDHVVVVRVVRVVAVLRPAAHPAVASVAAVGVERYGGVEVGVENGAKDAFVVHALERVAHAGAHAVPVVREAASLESELVEPLRRAVVVVEHVRAAAAGGRGVNDLVGVVEVRFHGVAPVVVQPRAAACGGGEAELGDVAVNAVAARLGASVGER